MCDPAAEQQLFYCKKPPNSHFPFYYCSDILLLLCFELPKGILRRCKAFLLQSLIRLMQEFGYCFSALREKSFQNSHRLQLHYQAVMSMM